MMESQIISLYRTWIGHISILALLLLTYLAYLPMKFILRKDWGAAENVTGDPWKVVVNYVRMSRDREGRTGVWFWVFTVIFALENVNMGLYVYFNLPGSTFFKMEKMDIAGVISTILTIISIIAIDRMCKYINKDWKYGIIKTFVDYKQMTMAKSGRTGIWFWIGISAFVLSIVILSSIWFI